MHLSTLTIAAVICVVAATNKSCAASKTSSAKVQQGLSFYKGHDLSSLKILEDGYGPGLGAVFVDTHRGNVSRPLEDILGDAGMNAVRLRQWVNSPPVPYDGGYYESYEQEYTLPLAKRFHQKGYCIQLVLYFSDYWTDPGQQAVPKAWPKTLSGLAATLREYVANVLLAYKKAGIDLCILSLGNEVRYGMMWDFGKADPLVENVSNRTAGFKNFAYLWMSARKGVDDAVAQGVKKPQVMIQIDNGWDLTIQSQWYAALTANNVPESAWDVMGFSFYPFYATGATFAALENSLTTLAQRYGKPIHITETGWPAVCYSTPQSTAPQLSEPNLAVSVQGQIEWTHRVIDILRHLPNNLGQGVWYWETGWLNNTGRGGCQDVILFDTDFSHLPKLVGYTRESVNIFKGV
ncbi:Arabinogalactan endo-beta-1,4-galactanase [Teratosphaeria destructans]|uniref:Arabinogalactan endo-beta-1,4-galactanase n=1 Tax=Teratosphaeria destructans TaxID=418781 RepID=A0A9W7W0M9_9PEZI|nr:Arabinogalactan endo-beta-1,4-galactanase [Teratosphaeria destructans]